MSDVLTDGVVKALLDWNYDCDFRLIWKLRKLYEAGLYADRKFPVGYITREEYDRASILDLLNVDNDEYWAEFADSYTDEELAEIEKFAKEGRMFAQNPNNYEKCEICPFNRNRNKDDEEMRPCGILRCMI